MTPCYLVVAPVLEVVDVEGERAGDGQRQVGDGGDDVHPGWPVEPLQTEDYHLLYLNLDLHLSLCVHGEGLHDLPDRGDDPDSVAADHEHHYVHTDAGQQDLTPAHILLLPQ